MVCLSIEVISARWCLVYVGLPKYLLCVAECMSLGCGFLVYWCKGLNGDFELLVRVRSSRCSVLRRGEREVLFMLLVCMYFVMVLGLLGFFVNDVLVKEGLGVWSCGLGLVFFSVFVVVSGIVLRWHVASSDLI